MAAGDHLLACSLSNLHTELWEDEHLGARTSAASSQFNYSLQLHSCLRIGCHGAAAAQARNILQPTAGSGGRTTAIPENT